MDAIGRDSKNVNATPTSTGQGTGKHGKGKKGKEDKKKGNKFLGVINAVRNSQQE